MRLVRGGTSDPNQGVKDLSGFLGKSGFKRVDAVFNGAGQWADIGYFTSGASYLRYNWITDKVDGPHLLAERWPALVPSLFHYFPVDPTDDLHTRILSVLQRCDGISHVNKPHLLGALVARGVDAPSRNIQFATNCATTAAGVLVAALGSLGTARRVHGELVSSYREGKAVAILRAIGLSGNAWISVTKPQRPDPCPEPGDLLFYATGNNEHVEWLMGEVEYRTVGKQQYPHALHGGGGATVTDDAAGNAAIAEIEAQILAATVAKRSTDALKKRLSQKKMSLGRLMKVNSFGPIHESHGRPLTAFLSIRRLLAAKKIEIP